MVTTDIQARKDISDLTSNVARLAALVENNEKRYQRDQDDIRSMAHGIKELNEKFSQVMLLNQDVARNREDIFEVKSDIKSIRHDFKNIEQCFQSIKTLSEKSVTMSFDIDALKARNIKQDGASAVIKILWASFGTAIMFFIYWLVSQYIGVHPSKSVIGEKP
jgi:chromosome segregation ATPase